MNIEHLLAWRFALEREAQRLRQNPRTPTDPIAQRRLDRVEFEVELLDDRIRECSGSSE